MNRTVVSAVALFLASAGLITVFKFRASEKSGTHAKLADAEKVRTMRFWEIFNQAGVLRTHGDCTGAATFYREALGLNPSHEDSLYYLGTCLYERGEYGEAEAPLRRLLELNPESGRGYGLLGRLLASRAPGAAANFREGQQAFERALQIYQEQAGPLLELGTLELNQGHLARAEQHFRAGVALGSPEAKFLTGNVLFLEGRSAEAEGLFKGVLDSYWADRKIVAKGVLSEGDILPAAGKPLTALQRSALKSALFSYWTALGNGVPRAQAAAALHLRATAPVKSGIRLVADTSGVRSGGGRAAWADFDHDNIPGLAVGGLGNSLVLYRSEAGRLVDVTKSAGLQGIRDVWEPYWADLDGDGYPDLFLVRPGFTGTGQNLLFRNDQDGTFSDVTTKVGLAGLRSTIRVCFADLEGNRRLDLVEVGAASEGHSSVRLFHNTGTRFVEQTEAGLKAAATAVDCTVADYDGDGKPDVFVQFWRQNAVLYRNAGGTKFLDTTQSAGLQRLQGPGFSSTFFDYDRDARPDLLLTAQAPLEDVARSILEPDAHEHGSTPRLFRNLGNGTFQEVTGSVGLDRAYGAMQALAIDLDRDGWTDVLLVSGSPDAQFLAPSVILRNVAGKKFEEWALAPAASAPGNLLGAAVSEPDEYGARRVYLAANPSLRKQHASGLFLMIPKVRNSGPPP